MMMAQVFAPPSAAPPSAASTTSPPPPSPPPQKTQELVVEIWSSVRLPTLPLRPGERTLLDRLTPDLGSPQANWARNAGVLREEMGSGAPIRDATVDPVSGELINNTGFLASREISA